VRFSQFLSPKHPPTGNYRQIDEHQTEGDARHEAERLKPSRYDDENQNIGDENIGVELDGIRHDARLYRRSVFIATKTPMAPAPG